jgi:tripartite-type tricarboxylate transporter receptor subunit TctC
MKSLGLGRAAVRIAAAALMSSCASGYVHAGEWPDKPIRVIVPLTAGSAVDIVPRIVLEEAAKELGQPFVFENRVGASGALAARAVATAAPDGYTLLAHSSALMIAPHVIANAGYDPVKDFKPVAALGIVPNVLVIAPSKHIARCVLSSRRHAQRRHP